MVKNTTNVKEARAKRVRINIAYTHRNTSLEVLLHMRAHTHMHSSSDLDTWVLSLQTISINGTSEYKANMPYSGNSVHVLLSTCFVNFYAEIKLCT